DVARFGDDEAVIFPVRGRRALEPVVLRSMDTVQVAGKTLEVVRHLRRHGEKPFVQVDVIGVGAGVADHLKQFKDELDVVEVNVAEKATNENYALLRDQSWFALRDWLREDGAIPQDPKLEGELVAPVYEF